MTHRTAVLSSFDEYRAFEDDAQEQEARYELLVRFPHAVMLKVAFPERDFANRWCWNNFGPADGECILKGSEYRVCHRDEPHLHSGTWTNRWFVKTDYDFGFSEWYFENKSHHDLFLGFVPRITWGENYPG